MAWRAEGTEQISDRRIGMIKTVIYLDGDHMPIDLKFPPKDLEKWVSKYFGKYTEMTAPERTDEDRLSFIEMIRDSMYEDEDKGVKEIIHGYIDHRIDDYGEDIPDREDFNTFEMMEHCYKMGFRRFDLENAGESSATTKERIIHTMTRIIRTVMNWERK